MKNRLIPCVLACLMIFLVGCNGNTAKEAAQEITKTETSFRLVIPKQILRKKRQKNRKARQFRKKHRLRQKKANQPLKGRRLRLFRQNRRKKKRLILLQPKSQRQSHRSRQPRRLNPKTNGTAKRTDNCRTKAG